MSDFIAYIPKQSIEKALRTKKDKIAFVIYADFETILKKSSSCKNNPEMSHMTEINKRTACGFSISHIISQKISNIFIYKRTACGFSISHIISLKINNIFVMDQID